MFYLNKSNNKLNMNVHTYLKNFFMNKYNLSFFYSKIVHNFEEIH